MTRGAKGWIAVFLLALVLGGFVYAFWTNETARARYWAWRARSTDRKVRLEARTKLLEVGRPGVDTVFADLVADEAADRISAIPRNERVLLVGCCAPIEERAAIGKSWYETGFYVDASFAGTCTRFTYVRLPNQWPDAFAERLMATPATALRMLVVGQLPRDGTTVLALLVVRLPAEDPLAPRVIAETRARVEAVK